MTLQLNRMGSTWNRQERININDNWDMIEQNFNGVVNKTVKQAYEEIIDTVLQESVWNWKAPVQTYDDIFTTYQNPETGDTTIVLDDGDKTGNVYRFKDGEWQFVFKINPDIYLQLQDEINQTNNNLTQLDTKVNEHLAETASQAHGAIRNEYVLFNGVLSSGGASANLVYPQGFSKLNDFDEIIVQGVLGVGSPSTWRYASEVFLPKQIDNIYFSWVHEILYNTPNIDTYWLRGNIEKDSNILYLSYSRVQKATSNAYDSTTDNRVTKVIGVKYE